MKKEVLMSCTFLCLAALLFAGAAVGNTLPDQAQLSAEVMFFNTETGDFSASGDVVIEADGLTARAPQGRGNVQSREVHFWDGITLSGIWRGDLIDLSAETVSFFFGQTPTYIAEGMVNGLLGKLYLDVDKFYMKGMDFAALNVHRLEDRELQITLSADRVDGVIQGGTITTFTAQGRVWLSGQPRTGAGAAGPVDIRGDSAVYSVERGSVVVSGNVHAVQQGRALTAGSIVYFPDINRIDAYGGTYAPASITIDISRESPQEDQP